MITSHTYKVTTPIFEGPLDLLLHLIEKKELDITRVSLALVTDQYLDQIRSFQAQSAENISEFLVVAARLIQIKSSVLLPRKSEAIEEEEDLGDQLARQLLIYKKFKQAARQLVVRNDKNLRTFLRVNTPFVVERKADISNITIDQLYNLAFHAIMTQDDREMLGTIVSQPKVTIRERIGKIIHAIKPLRQVSFFKLMREDEVETSNRLRIVVTFLALLELVKRRRILAVQNNLFSDIEFEPAEEWDENIENIEIEFGE